MILDEMSENNRREIETYFTRGRHKDPYVYYQSQTYLFIKKNKNEQEQNFFFVRTNHETCRKHL